MEQTSSSSSLSFFFEDLPSRTKCKVKCFERREAEARNTELLLVWSLSRSPRHNLNFYFLRVFCILNFPPPFHPSFSIPATFECFIFPFLGVQMILSFLFFIFTCPRGGVGGICFCVRALSVRFTSLRTCSPWEYPCQNGTGVSISNASTSSWNIQYV